MHFTILKTITLDFKHNQRIQFYMSDDQCKDTIKSEKAIVMKRTISKE